MFLYLELVDVVSNAFFELLNNESDKREILYSDIDKYGAKVIEKLNEEDGVYAVYVVSDDSQYDFFIAYKDYFELYTDDKGARGIKLKDNVSKDVIWNQFCAALSLKIIKAFQDKESIAVLGV